MSKNIGFSKKLATALAKSCCTSEVFAYPQREDHFNPNWWMPGARMNTPTYQWIVVLQKKQKRNPINTMLTVSGHRRHGVLKDTQPKEKNHE